jgi:DNA-binding response OmpR family regulator
MSGWLLELTARGEADVFDRAINLSIARLRRQIEIDRPYPEVIRKVLGVGSHLRPDKKQNPNRGE